MIAGQVATDAWAADPVPGTPSNIPGYPTASPTGSPTAQGGAVPSAVSPDAPPTPRAIPVRSERNWAVTFEAGWQGLAGVGPVITHFVTPRVAVDAGVGTSMEGVKSGIRARYNFRDGNWSPFVALGVIEASGLSDNAYKMDTESNVFEFGVRSSTFVQGGVGVEYVGDRGLVFTAMMGGAKLCRDNIRPISGVPTDSQKDDLETGFGSGVVLSLACGYAF